MFQVHRAYGSNIKRQIRKRADCREGSTYQGRLAGGHSMTAVDRRVFNYVDEFMLGHKAGRINFVLGHTYRDNKFCIGHKVGKMNFASGIKEAVTNF